jgi:hypothetical protein
LPDFFKIPDDNDLIELHAAVVYRMTREAEGVTLTTTQWLLMERICFNYILLRWKEKNATRGKSSHPGENAGFEHSKYMKDMNTFWLAMTHEWHQITSKKDDQVNLVDVMQKVSAAISAALDHLPTDMASHVRVQMASQFEQAGL